MNAFEEMKQTLLGTAARAQSTRLQRPVTWATWLLGYLQLNGPSSWEADRRHPTRGVKR